ncbi:MAG: hypothetical protein ACI9CF_001489, partial [Candidatus Omnitrophota bacterium]
ENIKQALVGSDTTQLIDLPAIGQISILESNNYPGANKLLSRVISNNGSILSYAEFTELHDFWQKQRMLLEPKDDFERHSRFNAQDSLDRAVRWVLNQLDAPILTDYIKRHIFEKKLQIDDAADFIYEVFTRKNTLSNTPEFVDMIWNLYLDEKNTVEHNIHFLDIVVYANEHFYLDNSLKHRIQSTLNQGNDHESHKALSVLLQLNLREEKFGNLIRLIHDSGNHSASVAAYAYLQSRFIGLQRPDGAGLEGRGGMYESTTDEQGMANALAKHAQSAAFFIEGLDDARRSLGLGAEVAARKVINYARALDRGAYTPGEHGRTWFTHLRRIAHNVRGYTPDFLQHIEGVLNFWLTGDEDILVQEWDNLLSMVYSAIEETVPGKTVKYHAILKHLQNEVIRAGLIPESEVTFVDSIREIDEEVLVNLLPKADDVFRSDDIEKMEYMLRLFFALNEKFGLTDKSIIPNIKGGPVDDYGSEYRAQAIAQSLDFANGQYEHLIQLIDSEASPQAIFGAVADLRYSIHHHLQQPRPLEENAAEYYDDEGESGSDNKLILDMDYELRRLGRILIAEALEPIDNSDSSTQIDAIVSIAKFVYSSGFGGSVFEQLLTELEYGELKASQVRDLSKLLRLEVQKALMRVDAELRFALTHFWTNNTDPRGLTDEWSEFVLTEEREVVYGDHRHEEEFITEAGIESLENELTESVVRNSNLLALESSLRKLERNLSAELSSDDDPWVRSSPNTMSFDDLNPFFIRSSDPSPQGDKLLLSWFGKKLSNLYRMINRDIPIPPFFGISAKLMAQKSILESPKFRNKVSEEIVDLRQRSTYPDLKFLLYARSGSAFMLPGLLVTIPNLGMNDTEVLNLAASTGDEWFAYDTYAEFIRSYAVHVLGIEEAKFQAVLDIYNKEELDIDAMKLGVTKYKAIITSEGHQIPDNIDDQAIEAIKVVYDSWDSVEAREYRDTHQISQEWGTTVIMQQAGFGNLETTETGEISGAGHASLRVQPNGSHVLFGRFRFRSIGEQLMTRADQNYILLSKAERRNDSTQTLEELRPDLYQKILQWTLKIKGIFHYDPMIEFVIQEDEVLITQSDDDYITDQYPEFETTEDSPIAIGYPVSGGALRGWVATNIEESKELLERYQKEKPDDIDGVILLIHRVSPEIINQIPQEIHIVSKIMSVHAKTLAQDRGITAISGIEDMHLDAEANTWTLGGQTLQNGEVISIDGHANAMVYHTSGNIYSGSLPIKAKQPSAANSRMTLVQNAIPDYQPININAANPNNTFGDSKTTLGARLAGGAIDLQTAYEQSQGDLGQIELFIARVDRTIGIEEGVKIALGDLVLSFRRDGESNSTLLVDGLLPGKPVLLNVKDILLDERSRPTEAVLKLSDLQMLLKMADAKRLVITQPLAEPAIVVLHVDSLTSSNSEANEVLIQNIAQQIKSLDQQISIQLEGSWANQEIWLGHNSISSRINAPMAKLSDETNYVHLLGKADSVLIGRNIDVHHRWVALNNSTKAGEVPIFADGSIMSYVNGVAGFNAEDLDNPQGTAIETAYRFYKAISQNTNITLVEFVQIIIDPSQAKAYAISPIARININAALRLYDLMKRQTARSA